jgi:hypothetical protein
MLRSSDVENLNDLLTGSRERATLSGDYETAIEEHDQVIRQCTKLQKSCDSDTFEKFEKLKLRCRTEVKILQDIVHELNELKKHNNVGNKACFNDAVDDPDVWPPPTPQPQQGRRNADDNLPSWARNAQPNPSRMEPSNRRVSGAGDDSRARRKDPVPENRRR